MAEAVVDIALLGDKELERKLAKLATPASQKRAVRPALRKSNKRLKAHVVANLSGRVVKPRTGRWLRATIAAKVKAVKRSRGEIGTAFAMPTREELGIDPGYEWYYPFAVEYGHPAPGREHASAKAPIRQAVNSHATEELLRIGKDVGKGIEKEAKKTA